MKTIYTHNGTFHADEVTAVALLNVFRPDNYEVKRVQHQTTEFPGADYVIDTGRLHDNITRFDHHQWEGGLSSAGLIWQHLNLKGYTQINEFIQAIDANDVGIKPATQFEYPGLISLYNHIDIHSEDQDYHFYRAVRFAMDIITSMKETQDILDKSYIDCAGATCWPGQETVLNLKTWKLGWSNFVNGETRPKIEAVTWYDEHLNTWNIQTTNKSPTSYEKVGRKLYPYDKMNFVHSNNFFAVAATKELMDHYIKNYLKD